VTELHGNWTADWAWSLPIVLLTVLGHSFGLLLVQDRVVPVLARGAHRFRRRFGLTISATMLLVIMLHAVEATAWAGAYVGLGALPEMKSAMLYSLEAMTTYGHAAIDLAPHWRLMGALEALNGMILFGLTTAFLFSVIQGISLPPRRDRSRRPPHGGPASSATDRHRPTRATEDSIETRDH